MDFVDSSYFILYYEIHKIVHYFINEEDTQPNWG